ncbi:MAG: hypothetical protein ABIP50_01295 [Candidatus Saccharimonadales bacterium]
MTELKINENTQSIFENLKKIYNGTECWDARELMSVAGYKLWRDFNSAIARAITAAELNGEDIGRHFLRTSAKNDSPAAKGRPGLNYLLTRTACYYIFQNGDSSKPEIAGAQAYFILQTRLQEISNQDRIDARRVNLHNKVLASEESLTKIANMHHDLEDAQRMHDAGSEGLYNQTIDNVEALKGIEEGQLFNYIDSPELAAHYFRITQTEVQLENDAYDGHRYDQEGLEYVAKGIGQDVRSVMRKRNRTAPEEMMAVGDIQPIMERLSGREIELMEQSPLPTQPPKPTSDQPEKPQEPGQIPLFDEPFVN